MPTFIDRPHHTKARLSLGDASTALSTADHLRFRLDHALARDAVHTPLDFTLLESGLHQRNLTPIKLRSASPDRATYLRRPDLGRTLHPDSIATLKELSSRPELSDVERPAWNVAAAPNRTLIILADGLSSLAIERHALPLLDATLPLISTGVPSGSSLPVGVATGVPSGRSLPVGVATGVPSGRSLPVGMGNPCPLIPLVQHARVAIGDEIGSLLHADLTLLLIGERPGLSSPDSLGCYITWQPLPGRTDAERNCISNIRAEGLSYVEAAHRIAHYIHQAFSLHTTGIALKDPDTTAQLPPDTSSRQP